jgi:hypothetical protein
MPVTHASHVAAYCVQCLHDVRLVSALEEPGRQAVDHRSAGELGIALFEYLL